MLLRTMLCSLLLEQFLGAACTMSAAEGLHSAASTTGFAWLMAPGATLLLSVVSRDCCCYSALSADSHIIHLDYACIRIILIYIYQSREFHYNIYFPVLSVNDVHKTCTVPSIPSPTTITPQLARGELYSAGTIVTYHCPPTHTLTSSPHRVCLGGDVWSGSLPFCIQKLP